MGRQINKQVVQDIRNKADQVLRYIVTPEFTRFIENCSDEVFDQVEELIYDLNLESVKSLLAGHDSSYDLESLNVTNLRRIATVVRVKYYSKMDRDELITAIRHTFARRNKIFTSKDAKASLEMWRQWH